MRPPGFYRRTGIKLIPACGIAVHVGIGRLPTHGLKCCVKCELCKCGGTNFPGSASYEERGHNGQGRKIVHYREAAGSTNFLTELIGNLDCNVLENMLFDVIIGLGFPRLFLSEVC